MRRITQFMERKNAGKIILGLFIVTNIIYVYMLMVTIPKTMAYANEMKLLDMLPAGYDWNYVNDLFTALGETGRNTYLTSQIPVDMVYPGLFAISYCLILAFFINKLGKLQSSWKYLCALPILAGIADYLENFGIITMLKNYPEITEASVQTTNIFSIIKSSTTSVFFLALIILLLLVGIKYLRGSKNTSK